MKNLQEIETRMSEIKEELTKEDADIESLDKEFDGLVEEKRVLNEKAEQRKKTLDKIARGEEGKEIEKMKEEPKTEERNFGVDSPEYRTAWAKTLMQMPLNESEKRALGVALTTTSSTYVTPTAEVDGVNNGGLFLPESVNTEILKEIELQSPFLADVAKTTILGTVKFPYKDTSSSPEKNTEGTDSNDGNFKWAELSLTVAEISKTVRITWKLEAMAVEDFISYIQSEIAIEVGEALADACLYGSGTNDVTGATVGAIDVTYADSILEGIKAGLKALPKRKRRGAKIYIAEDLATDITFAKDDQGRYQFNPVNSMGIDNISKYKVEVDPFLNDGDFVIGNASRNYRLNTSEVLTVVKDVQAKSRINDYVAYTVVAGAPVPNSFVYGTYDTDSSI